MLDALLDDWNFTRVPSHAGTELLGSPLHVLGIPSHQYAKIGSLADCFPMCAAASDCLGFTHYAAESICAFSRRDARLLKPDRANGGEVFIKQRLHPTASVPEQPVVQQLSTAGHRLFLFQAFATQKEVVALRKFAKACLRRKEEGSPDPRAIVGPSCPPGPAAVLLSRMEERIARLTGLPAHENEETLSFQPMESVGGDGPWFVNLHHDKNKNEHRVATALIYLSSSNDTDGGHTIFPALLPRRAPETSVGRRIGVDETMGTDATLGGSSLALAPFQRAARDAFAAGRRALGCKDRSYGCGDVGGLVPHAEAECSRALQGKSWGVAVRPQAGAALVFWSEHEDGTPNADMWHAGCLPRRLGTDGRWVMQRFKARSSLSSTATPPGDAGGTSPPPLPDGPVPPGGARPATLRDEL